MCYDLEVWIMIVCVGVDVIELLLIDFECL